MTTNGGQSDSNIGSAELFEAIAHPVRISILQVLSEKPLSFSDLKRAVEIESSGHLGFHLSKLRYLVKTNADGNYVLTDDGKEALRTARALSEHLHEVGPSAKRRWPKVESRKVITVIIAALIVLAGFGYYYNNTRAVISGDQNSINTLQSQIGSDTSKAATLQAQITSDNSTIQSLQRQLSSLVSRIVSLTAGYAKENGTSAALASELTSLNSQISVLNSQISSLNSQIASDQATLASLNSEISVLTSFLAFGPGSWSHTGNMTDARRDHTATILHDGRVLIVGWFTSVAELYDPVSGTFSNTGSELMVHGQGSTATLLGDGRVLVVGGTEFPGSRATAEIYNPTTGTFSLTGSLNVPRIAHTATLLLNGKVLIAAGQVQLAAGPQTIASAELYDPTTGTFSLTGSLKTDRSVAMAILLPNGRVLVAGGTKTTTPGYGVPLNSAELYNPVTGVFSSIGNMTEYRSGALGVVLDSGKVLITGDLSTSADLFNPATGTFVATGTMHNPHGGGTITLLPDGEVLVAGGSTGIGPLTTNSAELYNPVTGSFSQTGNMISARQEQTATLLSNCKVLVTGGYDGGELASAELFSFSNFCFLTGSGSIMVNGAQDNFGLVAGFKPGAASPYVSLRFSDNGSGITALATGITSYLVSGNIVTFSGAATVNGASGFTYQVTASDNDEPGAGSDTFSIKLSTGYGASGVLSAGNLELLPFLP